MPKLFNSKKNSRENSEEDLASKEIEEDDIGNPFSYQFTFYIFLPYDIITRTRADTD